MGHISCSDLAKHHHETGHKIDFEKRELLLGNLPYIPESSKNPLLDFTHIMTIVFHLDSKKAKSKNFFDFVY